MDHVTDTLKLALEDASAALMQAEHRIKQQEAELARHREKARVLRERKDALEAELARREQA